MLRTACFLPAAPYVSCNLYRRYRCVNISFHHYEINLNGLTATTEWGIRKFQVDNISSRNGRQKTYLSFVSRNCWQPTEGGFKCDTVLHRMAFVQQVKKLPTFYELLKLSPCIHSPPPDPTYSHMNPAAHMNILFLSHTLSPYSERGPCGILIAILQVQYFNCYYCILTTPSIFTRSE
jgi:hypothetical protein